MATIPNYYKSIPKKYLNDDNTYPNYAKTHIRVPCRVIFYGPAGSGKNNALIYWLNELNCFAEFYICAKNFEQPLWRWWIDEVRKLEKKLKISILFLCSEPSEMPNIETMTNDGKRRVFIWDDCLTCSKKEYELIAKPYVFGRNLNISCMFLAQGWTGISRVLRLNCDYIVIKKLNSNEDLKRIIRDSSLDLQPKQLKEMYKAATKDMNSFFLIDKVTNDPEYKFRQNFEPTAPGTIGDPEPPK